MLNGAAAPDRHVPGPGRPASAIRKKLKGSFANRVKILKEIADDGAKDSDRLKALDLMAKYGLGEAKGYDEALVEALGAVTRAGLVEIMGEDEADEAWLGIRERWVAVIGLHVRGQ